MSEGVIAGRYEVVREIARGGMGRVLEARDRVLGRDVAIKTLLRVADGVGRARFVEESQVTAQLAHPNIVAVHELGEEGGAPFLVMRLVRGKTLKDVARALAAHDKKARRDFTTPRLVRLFLKVCEAVAHAHGRGVIHRDLKPANVMVDEGDDVQVMDWGLARPVTDAGPTRAPREPSVAGLSGVLRSTMIRSVVRQDAGLLRPTTSDDPSADGQSGDLTTMGDVVGTPAYMPPEQADGGIALDARADVYSLGAILYELLVHAPPYSGTNFEVLTAVLKQAPVAPRATVAGRDLAPALEAIVQKAMARDRDERHQDAAALAADVEAWLDGRAVSAYRERPLEALRRVLSRHRALVATVSASFLAVNVALVGGTRAVSREEGRVVSETAAAEGAERAADAGAADAVRATRRTAAAAEALGLAGRSAMVLAELERRAGLPLPVADDAATGAEAGGSLVSLHELGRSELARLRAAIERKDAELVQAGGEPGALRGFLSELDHARGEADRIHADALLARAPSRLLADEAHLELGDERPVFLARAQLRLRRRREALAALGDAKGAQADAVRAVLLERDPTPGAPAGLEGVAALLRRTIEAEPGRSWLHLMLADVLAELGRFDEATASYERAAQLRRFDPWIYSSRLLHVYPVYHHYGELAGITASLVSSPEDLTAATIPERNALWTNGAGAWANLERAADALALKDPLLAAGRKADAALVLGRFADAEAAARVGLEKDPDDPACLGALAEARLEQADLPGAESTALRGLRVRPEDGRLNVTLGRVRLAQGRALEATPLLRLGARGSLTSDPWRYLAECLLAQDSAAALEEGVAAARKGLSFDPFAVSYYGASARPVAGDPRLERVLGDLRRKQGQPAAAAVHFVRAMIFASGRAKATLGDDEQDLLRCGDVHEELSLPNEAAYFFERAAAVPALAEQARTRLARLRERYQRGPR